MADIPPDEVVPPAVAQIGGGNADKFVIMYDFDTRRIRHEPPLAGV